MAPRNICAFCSTSSMATSSLMLAGYNAGEGRSRLSELAAPGPVEWQSD